MSDYTKKLLVCVDGSFPYMESCLNYTNWILKHTDAKADVLYVTDSRQFDFAMLGDFSGSLGAQPYLNLSKSLQRIEEEKIHLIKTKVEDYFKKSGLSEKVTFKTNRGSLVDSCQELENSAEGIDLLLLGKRGENASFATEHLGANLERVVRASGRPCWIANKEYVDIKKLALAYDDSESARHALQFLIRSPLFKSLAIDLVYVSDDATLSEEAKTMLNQAEKTLKDNGYHSVNVVCLQDDVCDGIAGHVVNQAIDLLIMGAYGHSAIRHLLIGSTTTELMRRCKISVLLFR